MNRVLAGLFLGAIIVTGGCAPKDGTNTVSWDADSLSAAGTNATPERTVQAATEVELLALRVLRERDWYAGAAYDGERHLVKVIVYRDSGAISAVELDAALRDIEQALLGTGVGASIELSEEDAPRED